MHSRLSRMIRKHRRTWLPAAVAGAAFLLAAMAWRSLRMPEPRPRREPPEETGPERPEGNSRLPLI